MISFLQEPISRARRNRPAVTTITDLIGRLRTWVWTSRLRFGFQDLSGFALVAALALAAPFPALAASTVLIYGDSLSAAYGIRQSDGWATLLQKRLRDNGFDYTVVNASISGETSSGGASRIAATLAQSKPKVTVVALGANDGLRGLPVAQLRANLTTIIQAAKKAGSKVLLVGMRMPPNYGAAYTDAFAGTYKQLARQFKLTLVPFLLEGIADRPELFQPDQLHPIAEAQSAVLDNVWQALAPLLR